MSLPNNHPIIFLNKHGKFERGTFVRFYSALPHWRNRPDFWHHSVIVDSTGARTSSKDPVLSYSEEVFEAIKDLPVIENLSALKFLDEYYLQKQKGREDRLERNFNEMRAQNELSLEVLEKVALERDSLQEELEQSSALLKVIVGSSILICALTAAISAMVTLIVQ